MDNFEETTKVSRGFVNHVFKMDSTTKNTLMNLSQYSALAIVPIVLMNKVVQRYFPKADERKGTLEILGEVIAQVVSLVLGLFFIDRMVSFVPTYSGAEIPEVNLFHALLPLLVIILSFQTKVGDKVNILVDRLVAYIDGEEPVVEEPEEEVEAPKKGGKLPPAQPTHQPSRADYVDAHQGMVTPQTAAQEMLPPAPGANLNTTAGVTAGMDFSGMYQEPMAMDMAGGFSSF